MDDLDLDLEPGSPRDSQRSIITLLVIMGLLLLWGTVIAPALTKRPRQTEEGDTKKTSTADLAAKPPKPPGLTTAAPAKPTTAAPVAPPPKPTTAAPVAPPPKPTTAIAVAPPKPPEEEPQPEPVAVTKRSKGLCATFTNEDAALARLVLLDYFSTPLAKRDAQKARQADPEADLSPYGLPLLGQIGTETSLVLTPRTGGGDEAAAAAAPRLFAPRRFRLVADEERKVAFRTVFPGTQLEVTKTFLLPKPEDKAQRHIILEIQFKNLSDRTLEVPGYLLRGPGGLAADLTAASWKAGKTVPNEKERKQASSLLYAAVATQSEGGEVNVVRESCSSVRSRAEKKKEPFEREAAVLWAAVESSYFAAILGPRPKESQSMKVWSGGGRSVGEHNVNAHIQVASFSLEAKGRVNDGVVHRYRLFAGPKIREILASYNASYESIIKRHWYDLLSALMSGILHTAHAATFNYGIAIVILTIIVRLGLYPLSRKSQTAMAKMQKLQPQVQEVRDKFKTDKKRQQQEMMSLYKDYGVNPLGGCLPMLLQLPVFIGLFNALRTSIELRHACFIPWWIEDLSQPDAFLGIVNLLPIISVVIMFIQQRMTPKSLDPQQQQTQKLMGYMMPAFLGFIFYNMPSGLNVYFIASMGIGIIEQKLIRRQIDKMGDLKPVKKKPSKGSKRAVASRGKKTPKRKHF